MASRPTIIDVAKLAGVSKTTVSRVVRGETKKVGEDSIQRVKKAIETLGYERNFIASSLRTERTFTVMLMIPDITNPFWPEVARGIQDANIDWSKAREKAFLRLATQTRMDGLLINPIHVTKAELLETKISTVILGTRPGFFSFNMVGSDTNDAIKKALTYLFELGHRKIGFLLGKSEYASSSSRYQNVTDFYKSQGLPLNEDYIVDVTFDEVGGMAGIKKLMQLDLKPTAVLASNDLMALGALQEAHKMGYRVPKDISIMGIDDIHAASLTVPSLTTIRKQKYQIGQRAAEILLERMNSDKEGAPIVEKIPCTLVIRNSTHALL